MLEKLTRVVRATLAMQALVLLVAGAGICGEVPGKWELVDADPATSEFYYDTSALKRAPQGVVAVRVKMVYGTEGKAEALQVLGSDRYAGLAVTVYEYDLDCSNLTTHLKTVAHFDYNGEKIAGFNLAGKTAWEDITPYSRLDLLQVEVCE